MPAAMVQLRRARVAVPGSFLRVFQLRAVFERRDDEGGAHFLRDRNPSGGPMGG